ncbi:MAG: hypothetical protein HC809_12910, partial [Gammaproteobacteria bacterium]|nr:hypothetical protein [Gammaproteobacteria bacterium]
MGTWPWNSAVSSGVCSWRFSSISAHWVRKARDHRTCVCGLALPAVASIEKGSRGRTHAGLAGSFTGGRCRVLPGRSGCRDDHERLRCRRGQGRAVDGRWSPSPVGAHPVDYTWQLTGRNKRSLALDFANETGREILLRLVDGADVFLVNLRADQIARYRLTYEELAARNPRLVYASISGYGQHGPYRLRPGFDQIAQGLGGLMSITGLPGQGPVRV